MPTRGQLLKALERADAAAEQGVPGAADDARELAKMVAAQTAPDTPLMADPATGFPRLASTQSAREGFVRNSPLIAATAASAALPPSAVGAGLGLLGRAILPKIPQMLPGMMTRAGSMADALLPSFDLAAKGVGNVTKAVATRVPQAGATYESAKLAGEHIEAPYFGEDPEETGKRRGKEMLTAELIAQTTFPVLYKLTHIGKAGMTEATEKATKFARERGLLLPAVSVSEGLIPKGTQLLLENVFPAALKVQKRRKAIENIIQVPANEASKLFSLSTRKQAISYQQASEELVGLSEKLGQSAKKLSPPNREFLEGALESNDLSAVGQLFGPSKRQLATLDELKSVMGADDWDKLGQLQIAHILKDTSSKITPGVYAIDGDRLLTEVIRSRPALSKILDKKTMDAVENMAIYAKTVAGETAQRTRKLRLAGGVASGVLVWEALPGEGPIHNIQSFAHSGRPDTTGPMALATMAGLWTMAGAVSNPNSIPHLWLTTGLVPKQALPVLSQIGRIGIREAVGDFNE